MNHRRRWPKDAGNSYSATVHGLTKATRPHVGPDFVYVGEARLLLTLETRWAPTGRDRPLHRPDGVLVLVVDDHPIHLILPYARARRCRRGIVVAGAGASIWSRSRCSCSICAAIVATVGASNRIR